MLILTRKSGESITIGDEIKIQVIEIKGKQVRLGIDAPKKFAIHRENPTCAGCHSKLDPLGFALENFDITGRWRDKYENGREVDSSGKLMRKYEYDGIVRFKESLVKEKRRFAKALTGHLLRFALSRELDPFDSLAIDAIVNKTEKEDFKLKSLIREVVLSDRFLQSN